MKITNFVLINFMNALETFRTKKLPQKISYAITKNMLLISDEYKVYETQLQKIFEDYAEYMQKDDAGNISLTQNGLPIVEETVSEEFHKQIEELLGIEIDVDIHPLDFDAFDYDDKNGLYDILSADDMMILQSILCPKL